jgi:hypothetical protein
MPEHRGPNYTVSEPLTVRLSDGTEVTGTLRMEASRRGSFEVWYDMVSRSDGRSDHADEVPMKTAARAILREMAEGKIWKPSTRPMGPV